MNIKENIMVHNKFEVLVVDVNTGKEKQRAVGYNIILDNWLHCKTDWTELPGDSNHVKTREIDLLSNIDFGSGTGTIAANRTTLFTYTGYKPATTLQTVYAYLTSYVQKQIILPADQYNTAPGNTIKEVGFSKSYSNGRVLMTHAVLQDSEGNEIVIVKTDIDVIYITATFYCTHTPAGFGTGAIYPEASKNFLVSWVLSGTFDEYIHFARFPLTYSSDMLSTANGGKEKYTGRKSFNINSATGTFATGTLALPLTTFLNTECNNRIVKHIGGAGIGAVTLPNHDIFAPYEVERIPIGTGNGVLTDFNIIAPIIMEDSETIYVNNVSQIKDVDYTIDYESNCGDWYENYYTAGMSCKSGVTFGDIATGTPSAIHNYVDPISWWSNNYDIAFYPVSVLVTDAYPIHIDFGTSKPCNTLKIDILTVPSGQIANLKIYHSSDDTNWSEVSGMSRVSQVWKWTETTARYWKVVIPSYSWTYPLYYQSFPTRDGQVFGSSFFLGKTVLGLHFITAPTSGAAIDATYSLEYPFKTANNLLRFTYSIVLQRG